MTRWITFNAVGALGFALQLGLLAVLLRLGLPLIAATALAVEAAVLHNFVWHEHWTWRDRRGSGGAAARVLRFHALNGVVSLIGNVVVTTSLVAAGARPLVANAIAVAVCSLVNYVASDWLVFDTRREARSERCEAGGARREAGGARREARGER